MTIESESELLKRLGRLASLQRNSVNSWIYDLRQQYKTLSREVKTARNRMATAERDALASLTPIPKIPDLLTKQAMLSLSPQQVNKLIAKNKEGEELVDKKYEIFIRILSIDEELFTDFLKLVDPLAKKLKERPKKGFLKSKGRIIDFILSALGAIPIYGTPFSVSSAFKNALAWRKDKTGLGTAMDRMKMLIFTEYELEKLQKLVEEKLSRIVAHYEQIYKTLESEAKCIELESKRFLRSLDVLDDAQVLGDEAFQTSIEVEDPI